MVVVSFIDGTEESFETRECDYAPWRDSPSGDFLVIPYIEGDVWCRKEYVKSIRAINIE